MDDEDITPIKTSAKEHMMNTINANTTNTFGVTNDTNSYTIKNESFKVNNTNSGMNTNGFNLNSNSFNVNTNGLNSNSSFNTNSNSFNSVNTTIGSNTTTIIAEIEGEVKKKTRHYVDKTYYIAKEILMTELTYKKDLDVINVVS